MFDTSETIAAIATARDGSLRGIVRVSGPRVVTCLKVVFQAHCGADLSHFQAGSVVAGNVHAASPIGAVPCDVYWWPSQRSYTRQPCCEIHTLGSPPILDAVLAAICQAGARLAQPGEFTMRAFLAGRLDLTQAEAVLGVIDARNATELNVALRQLAGGLAKPLHALRDQLLDALAQLEAGLDFVEDDIEFITPAELDRQLAAAQETIEAIAHQMAQRTHLSDEPRIVLMGWPNVGKSSLFNALTEGEPAIVSAVAGTTRDYVTHRVELNGRTISLIDTAGIELTEHSGVGSVAQMVTAEQSSQATLRLLCLDATRRVNAWEQRQVAQSATIPQVIVLTKCDLEHRCDFDGQAFLTSCRTGQGLAELRQAIASQLDASPLGSTCVASTAFRCQESLRRAAASLVRARTLTQTSQGDELIAAELRIALDELGAVVGTVYTDDILDRIFSRFCIGK